MTSQLSEATAIPNAMEILEATSRTFFIPISRMPDGLREATASAYLCMRAIDEIEDHPHLDNETKARILREVSLAIQGYSHEQRHSLRDILAPALMPYAGVLPDVSVHLAEWATYAPDEIAPRIWADTAAMAERMAHWANVNWRIDSQTDLDAYTYSVAAAVGLLMCDIMAWYDGTQMDRRHAIHFGRGLQMTNIARNRAEDLQRGANFFPPGWTDADVRTYAAHWLKLTSDYAVTLPEAPFSYLIKIPLALAQATLQTLNAGHEKLSREQVIALTRP
jgi:farnesyl-diphosphate farnesyltransferase